MLPPIVHNNLHLANEAKLPRFLSSFFLLLPLSDPSSHAQFLEPGRRKSPSDSVFPQTKVDLRQADPTPWLVYRFVCLFVISDSDVGVQKHASGPRCGVVGVDQAAFGALEVGFGESVVDATEL